MSDDDGCSTPAASRKLTVRTWRLSDGEVRTRLLGDDEVRKWRDDIDAQMVALEQRWKESENTDVHALLGALIFCEAWLPPWLFKGLFEMLKAQLPQEPDIHSGRWLLVMEGRSNRLSWEKAYEYAAERARGRYAGTARTMKGSYQIAQRKLPRKPGHQQQAKPGPGQK